MRNFGGTHGIALAKTYRNDGLDRVCFEIEIVIEIDIELFKSIAFRVFLQARASSP